MNDSGKFLSESTIEQAIETYRQKCIWRVLIRIHKQNLQNTKNHFKYFNGSFIRLKFKCADVQRQMHRQQRAVVVNFHRFHHVYYFPNSNTASLFIPFYVFNGRCHDFTTGSFSCNSERNHSLFNSIGSRSREKVKGKKKRNGPEIILSHFR